MANPLLLFLSRPLRGPGARRRAVAVPEGAPSTEAIFLVLRRMRTPLVILTLIFMVCVTGLTLAPGHVGSDGEDTHMSVFESFYFLTYTFTTIGYGELKDFSTPQRMWITLSIYLGVLGWAYTIGTSLALVQDPAFREAVATQGFRRRVRGLREGFVLVAGYGKAGRAIVRELDRSGRRVVVVESNPALVDRVGGDPLYATVPALEGDASLPGVLGMAGLGSPHCRAVLAATGNDETNLGIVMAAGLLRPGLPVYARCHSRVIAERMADFDVNAVVDPEDRYGNYLLLALRHPATYRLVTWLIGGEGAPMPVLPHARPEGRWIVVGDGTFAHDVTADLRAAGLEVDEHDPATGHPDVTGAAGVVAGTDSDTLNLSIAEHVRLADPELFVSVRQHTTDHLALAEALQIDSVYTPTNLVAGEMLARVVTPVFWGFVEYAVTRPDAWAQELLDRLVASCGERGPRRVVVRLVADDAHAVERWLSLGHRLRVGDLSRHPEDRDTTLAAVPLLIHRGDDTLYAPSPDEPLHVGDEILFAGRRHALDLMDQTLDYDSVVEYVATGRRVPDAWVWRALFRRHRSPGPDAGSA